MLEEQQKSPPNSPFFLIPNPNPLLRSFKIPPPVIHPPGVDPHSLLNPITHDNGVLETQMLSPLDIDPSAASRSEIVPMTIGLTVSELAGGTFCEPTTMVATSDSPANSEVGLQQLVNDIVGKKLKNSQITVCDVCNVTCSSKTALETHKKGKKHLNNIQKLALSSTIHKETQPTVAINATLNQESEKNKKNDLLQNNVLDLERYNLNGTLDPPVTEKHTTQVRLCGDTLPNATSESVTPAQSSNSSTQKVEGELNIRQFTWCEICKVNCSSENNFAKHILGKKHLKKLKVKKLDPPSSIPFTSLATTPPITNNLESFKLTELEMGETVDSHEAKTVWCDLCKVLCDSSILSTHLSGKKHMKNLQKGEVVNPKSARCELCGIFCNSTEALNDHLSGQKHLKELRKSEKRFDSSIVAAKRPLEDPMNEEEDVILGVESVKRKADMRLSDEEPFVKKQKVVKKKEEGECGAYVTCTLCNVHCTSVEAFNSHRASNEHSAMVLKQVQILK